jgi:hypothetical protein
MSARAEGGSGMKPGTIYLLTAEPWKAEDQTKSIEAKLRRLMVRATYNRKDKKSLLKISSNTSPNPRWPSADYKPRPYNL